MSCLYTKSNLGLVGIMEVTVIFIGDHRGSTRKINISNIKRACSVKVCIEPCTVGNGPIAAAGSMCKGTVCKCPCTIRNYCDAADAAESESLCAMEGVSGICQSCGTAGRHCNVDILRRST